MWIIPLASFIFILSPYFLVYIGEGKTDGYEWFKPAVEALVITGIFTMIHFRWECFISFLILFFGIISLIVFIIRGNLKYVLN